MRKPKLQESWTPTAENVNELPLPLRRYILDLETNADPAGTLRQNFQLWQENEALRKECERLNDRFSKPQRLSRRRVR
jgi:hypothetical protein